LAFVRDTFTLIQESGQDGDILARERAEADRVRVIAEKTQAALFIPPRKH
jgi:hypothetical protein